MVQLLVILAFLTLHLHEHAAGSGLAPAWSPATTAMATLAPLAVLWLLGQYACVRAGRMLDADGDLAAAFAADRFVGLARLVGGGVFALAMGVAGWGEVVRGVVGDVPVAREIASISPLLAFLAGGWWSIAPIDRRLREARLFRGLHEGAAVYRPPTRVEFVWANVRHQVMLVLIPLTLLSAWRDGMERWGDRLPWFAGASESAASWGRLALDLAGVAVVFIITPALIRVVWDTVPITGGAFRETLDAMCRRYGVRMRVPLLWRTHGAMVNGAVLGLVWPFRYLMFTDALFDRLSARQVEGVAAHEVGHIKRRHILWLGISVFAAIVGGEWLGIAAAWATRAGEKATEGVVVGAAIAATAMAFGWVSRRFEWQADAFAVQHLSRSPDRDDPGAAASERVTPGAIATMTSALLDVAAVNGIDPRAFTFRHGSIATRVRRLRAMEGTPVDLAPIDRQVRWMKWTAAVVLVLGGGAMVAMEWVAR